MGRKSRKTPYLLNKEAGDPEPRLLPEREKKRDALPTGAYIRLSAENSGNSTDETLQTQITLVRQFIDDRDDLILRDTYIDNGFTGTNFERPEFLRMMEDVKQGIIRCIVVKDLSRFGRDYLETGYYLESIFPLLNVRFIAITDNFDSFREEDRNNLAIPIKNMVNAMYAKDFSRKQEVFHEMCRKSGRYLRHTEPFGYVHSEDGSHLVIDKTVEPYVRLVFAWALAGVSRSEIARRMEFMLAPTSSSKEKSEGERIQWTASTVKAILFNPTYAGFHVMGKSKVSSYRGIKPTRVKRDEWLYFPDFHEAYITMDDYKTIEEMISKSKSDCYKRMDHHAESRERMQDCFKGLVFCADCGRQMNFCRGSHHRDYSERSFQYYRCRYDRNYEQCSNMFVQQNYLKIVVMDQLRLVIQVASDKKKLLEELEKGHGNPRTINPIERNIKRLTEKERIIEERIMKLFMDRTEGLLDEDDFIKLKESYTLEKAGVVRKRKEFENRLVQAKKAVQRYRDITDEFEKILEGTEFSEELVKEMVSKIIVNRDNRIELVLKCQDIFDNPLVDEYLGKGGETI